MAKVKLEKEVHELQSRVQHLQNIIGIADLSEIEIANIQMILMDDDQDEIILANQEPSSEQNANVNVGASTSNHSIDQNSDARYVQQLDPPHFDTVAGFISFVENVSNNPYGCVLRDKKRRFLILEFFFVG